MECGGWIAAAIALISSLWLPSAGGGNRGTSGKALRRREPMIKSESDSDPAGALHTLARPTTPGAKEVRASVWSAAAALPPLLFSSAVSGSVRRVGAIAEHREKR